jgi:hypothetical protein
MKSNAVRVPAGSTGAASAGAATTAGAATAAGVASNPLPASGARPQLASKNAATVKSRLLRTRLAR